MEQSGSSLVPLPEAAHRLGMSWGCAWRLMLIGELPGVKRGGRWYVEDDDLQMLVERRSEDRAGVEREAKGSAELQEPVTTAQTDPARSTSAPSSTLVDSLRSALRIAEHELTTLHGLYADDNQGESWRIDTSKALGVIEDALKG